MSNAHCIDMDHGPPDVVPTRRSRVTVGGMTRDRKVAPIVR